MTLRLTAILNMNLVTDGFRGYGIIGSPILMRKLRGKMESQYDEIVKCGSDKKCFEKHERI